MAPATPSAHHDLDTFARGTLGCKADGDRRPALLGRHDRLSRAERLDRRLRLRFELEHLAGAIDRDGLTGLRSRPLEAQARGRLKRPVHDPGPQRADGAAAADDLDDLVVLEAAED